MRIRIFIFVLFCLPLLAFSETGSVDVRAKMEAFSQEDSRVGLDKAKFFITGFTAALKSGKYEEFQKVLPKNAAKPFTETDFRNLYSAITVRLGQFQSSEYLGELNNTFVYDYIWKIRFSGSSKSRELLYRVRVGKTDGRLELAGFGFMP